jgi:hypothetical protein
VPKEKGELFATFDLAIGYNRAKSERATFGMSETTVVDCGKVRVLGGETLRVKGVKNVFVDTGEVCGKGSVMQRNWVRESTIVVFKEVVIERVSRKWSTKDARVPAKAGANRQSDMRFEEDPQACMRER